MNRYFLNKKKEVEKDVLYLTLITTDSDEHQFSFPCDETFNDYISHNFNVGMLIFEEGVDFDIINKEVGSRTVKNKDGIPYDYHRYFEKFANLKK